MTRAAETTTDTAGAPASTADTPGTPDPADAADTADIAVIGAGPSGLHAAYYSGFRGLTCVVIDALDHPGGQVAALYPEKALYDIAGHPAIKGRELIDNLVAQAAVFEPRYLLGHTATTLTRRAGGGWTVSTDRGRLVHAGAVVIAAGLGRFTPRALPCALPYLGRGAAYHVPRPTDHAGRDVVIVGGGDSAVDWALALAPIARSTTLVHRRGSFRAHEHSVKQLYDAPVRILTDAQVTACHGEGRLERVTVTHGEQSAQAPAQALVAALGFSANLGPLADWGARLEHRAFQVDPATQRTSLPEVYAVGDGCARPGRVPLISVGFGEAATAVNHAAVALRPGSRLAPEHSSDVPPPGRAARKGW